MYSSTKTISSEYYVETQGDDLRASSESNRSSSSRIARSQEVFALIWNMFISLIESDPPLSAESSVTFTEIDRHEAYGALSTIHAAYRSGERRITGKDASPDPIDLRSIRIALMRQLLINASLQASLNRQRRTVTIENSVTLPSVADGPLRMELGLHCQETEFLRVEVIKSLRALVTALEADTPKQEIAGAVGDLWRSIWAEREIDLIETQLFYADCIYAALPDALSEAGDILGRHGLGHAGLDNCLTAYTWLYGDRDGRPHDTDAHTERLIIALEKRVRANYQRDLAQIAATHAAKAFFDSLAERLDPNHPMAFKTPQHLMAELLASAWHADKRIQALVLRLTVFGFYYLKIEFRQNAGMFTEVVDSLVPAEVITEILGPDRASCYAELPSSDRVELLTRLHAHDKPDLPERLWERFWEEIKPIFDEKTANYKGLDYIDIYRVDREYIVMLNAVMTLNCLRMLKTYSDRITIHGIAEANSIDEPLALLFLLSAAGHRNGIDIALQPEDLEGAEAILQTVEDLYANPVYREHLELRGDRQFITFGPSDTGKQGGKAMHIANMQIAKLHKLIARRFGIELIPSIVIGYEHARSNGPIAENLGAFGAFDGAAARYMLSGILEMRSHLLTPVMAHQCLRDLFLTNALRRPILEKAEPPRGNKNQASHGPVDWIAIVRLYKQKFFNHPVLPDLLRGMARFDIVRANTKSTRPPSRAFDVLELESQPAAIRAIPWTRALLLSGVHHELIGASLLAARDAVELHDLHRSDPAFRGYIRNIAYAAARTRMELAWQTLVGTVPALPEIVELAGRLERNPKQEPRCLLASIHLEYVQAKRLVHKAQHEIEPERPEALTAAQLLRAWPALAREVAWKELEIDGYIPVLVATRHEKQRFGKLEIQDIYSGFILSANTDLFFYAPEEANALPW